MLARSNASIYLGLLMIVQVFFSYQGVALGLEPEEILVIANKNIDGSVDIAQYYMKQRGIPESHLLAIALSLNETMSRQEYEKVLSKFTKNALRSLLPKYRISAIVLVYGVPLKVAPPLVDEKDLELIRQYRQERDDIASSPDISVEDIDPKKKGLSQKITLLQKTNQRAAVDSELSLVKVDEYSLEDQIMNPYFIGFQGMTLDINKDQVLLV